MRLRKRMPRYQVAIHKGIAWTAGWEYAGRLGDLTRLAFREPRILDESILTTAQVVTYRNLPPYLWWPAFEAGARARLDNRAA